MVSGLLCFRYIKYTIKENMKIYLSYHNLISYSNDQLLVSRHILATLGAGIIFGFSFAYMLLSVAKFGSVQDHYVG